MRTKTILATALVAPFLMIACDQSGQSPTAAAPIPEKQAMAPVSPDSPSMPAKILESAPPAAGAPAGSSETAPAPASAPSDSSAPASPPSASGKAQ